MISSHFHSLELNSKRNKYGANKFMINNNINKLSPFLFLTSASVWNGIEMTWHDPFSILFIETEKLTPTNLRHHWILDPWPCKELRGNEAWFQFKKNVSTRYRKCSIFFFPELSMNLLKFRDNWQFPFRSFQFRNLIEIEECFKIGRRNGICQYSSVSGGLVGWLWPGAMNFGFYNAIVNCYFHARVVHLFISIPSSPKTPYNNQTKPKW